MNNHLRATATKIRLPGGAIRYRPTIVDTANRPHFKTYVGTTQAGAGAAKAIAEGYVSGQQEKAR
jgi:hypothetical protein